MQRRIGRNLLGYVKRISFVFYVLFMAVFIAYHLYYAKKVISGVYVRDIYVGNKSSSEIVRLLSESLKPSKFVVINIGGEYTTKVSVDDINFKYLPVETTKRAFFIGRGNSFLKNFSDKFYGFFEPIKITPVFQFNQTKLDEVVRTIQREAAVEVQEPRFVLDNGKLFIEAGVTGYYFNESELKDKIINSIDSADLETKSINFHPKQPSMTVADLDLVKQKFQEILDTKFRIMYGDKSWKLSQDEVLSLVIPRKVEDNIVLSIDSSSLKLKVSEIALDLDRNSRGQVLDVKDGKVTKFINSLDGLKVKQKESAEIISKALLGKDSNIQLAVQITNAPETNNEYGIREVIGIGRSKFKGSAKGRVHNIELAASRISGTLVSPGEVFSFNEAVGEISRKTGYTSAWIISKGRTILGDGGGVCQVSTTAFRAALNAGLPIVTRNAHSYRVSYYEQDSPPGIDATIYRPSVDLKFKNDTSGYILIVSEFDKEDTSLAFKIYGTHDGREVEMTKPKTWARRAPPASIYEEDTSLPKGTTRQVEYPVWGASVSFDRIVRKNGEVLYKDTFKSNYRPWPAVYKVGIRG